MKSIKLILLLAAWLCLASMASATTLRVARDGSQSYSIIQEAIITFAKELQYILRGYKFSPKPANRYHMSQWSYGFIRQRDR